MKLRVLWFWVLERVPGSMFHVTQTNKPCNHVHYNLIYHMSPAGIEIPNIAIITYVRLYNDTI